MQLGTRWSVGATSPASLPAVMRDAVDTVETGLVEDGVDTSSWRWTLTYLEGRPIAQLDDGATLSYDPVTDTVSAEQRD
ncbi:hypothetical protein BH11ACT3_BH11ACT3_15430 [soil metagenome]